MNQVIQQLKAVYATAATFDPAALKDVYAENVEFIDPVHRISGLDALASYLAGVYVAVEQCEFIFDQTLVDGDQAVLLWTMNYKHPRLNKGASLSLRGNTHIRVEGGKIVYQADYYDLGAMLYEQVPLLGTVVNKLKRRLG